jgi:hypothetical protein
VRVYSAFYKDNHTDIIFRFVPRGDVRKRLPPGTRVHVDADSTLGRLDGGDEFEHAYFEVGGRIIVVQGFDRDMQRV